jgi:hypothetical protein
LREDNPVKSLRVSVPQFRGRFDELIVELEEGIYQGWFDTVEINTETTCGGVPTRRKNEDLECLRVSMCLKK